MDKPPTTFFILLFLGMFLQNCMSISTCDELFSISDNMEGKYTLSCDLDCSKTKLSPIGGAKSFKGSLDGAGHTIYGIRMDGRGDKTGLFSFGEGAFVKNLIFQHFQVESEGSSVGLIFGEAKQVLIQNVTLCSSNRTQFSLGTVYVARKSVLSFHIV